MSVTKASATSTIADNMASSVYSNNKNTDSINDGDFLMSARNSNANV